MPREICQTGKFFQRVRPAEPCLNCVRRKDCLVHLAQRQLFERSDPTINKAHIISSCSAYEASALAESGKADIRPNLHGSGISHLCRKCDERHGLCQDFQYLEDLKRVAKANDIEISLTVVCCSTVKEAGKPKKSLPVLQIGQEMPI